MATTTMKGLIKGLRYISQIFDEGKEPEMQIGFPTDVKHVAHIGWDGPVDNSPSWMDNFKTDQDSMSGPLGAAGSSLRGSLHGSSPARDLPDLPLSSRRCSTNGDFFSMDREKSEKPSSKHSRKSKSANGTKELSGNSSNRSSSARNQLLQDSAMGRDSPAHNLPEVPKRSRRKKSKDSSQGGSSKSSSITAEAIAEASASTSTSTTQLSEPCLGSIPMRNTALDSCPFPNPQPLDEVNIEKLNGFS